MRLERSLERLLTARHRVAFDSCCIYSYNANPFAVGGVTGCFSAAVAGHRLYLGHLLVGWRLRWLLFRTPDVYESSRSVAIPNAPRLNAIEACGLSEAFAHIKGRRRRRWRRSEFVDGNDPALYIRLAGGTWYWAIDETDEPLASDPAGAVAEKLEGFVSSHLPDSGETTLGEG